jgi:ssDNA-binding Zn-finger/Zn-ribbon topoisomerase 1|tara:strand:+ start:347 stop:742 length:396 start_codon:yes stop_codon:yes gene_type:complete
MVTEPESMNDVIYFSNRSVGTGKVRAWVYRKQCPECDKAKMGKPVVKGKVKIRAKEYVCPGCNHTEEKEEHEESLTLEAIYTCPECGKEGEGTTMYKRKSFQGVKAYVVECQHCEAKIPITKKLKAIKKKE